MCRHEFIQSAKPGYVACSRCGTFHSAQYGAPAELYGNDYWSHARGHSTIQEQVHNVANPVGSAPSKNDKVMQYVPARGGAALEVACAPGELLKRLAARFTKVYGIEVDPKNEPAIREASEGKAELLFGLFPEVTKHFSPASLDCIIGLDVFEHVPDSDAFVRECRRLLKPGGALILMSPFVYADGVFDDGAFRPDEHVWLYSEKWLREAFAGDFDDLRFERWLPGHELFVCTRKAPVAPAVEDARYDSIACPFCASVAAEPYRQAADIVKCRGCGTVYLRTRLKQEAMEQLYQSYVDDGSHLKLPANATEAAASPWKRKYLIDEILELNAARGPLLDVGCSWGAFLLGAREQGFTPMGIELTRKAVRFANETLGIPVVNTQFLDTAIPAASLQVVTMIHVLEHLPQPRQAIAKTFDSLKPGGLFCGIVPNFDSFCSQTQKDDWYWLDPNYHYVHYTPATLRAHLEAAGFEVVRLYTATGDFEPEKIPCDPSVLPELEARGQGEELRFFARKPATVEQPVTNNFTLPLQTFDWPAALDPYVCRHDGRFFYLSDAILERPGLLAEVEPFHFHCGGAGDALLLIATFYDKEPASVVVSYPNSLPAMRSFFEAFPALRRIYLLPQQRDVRVNAELRALMPTLPNCKGMGVTPRRDFCEEWSTQTDIFRDYGVVARPDWAKRCPEAKPGNRAAIAPRGSLAGMAGSKRNIIEPADWPELLRFLKEQGFTPVIIGTPDERAEYPCLDGCEDRRSYSFREQMEQIAGSAIFVGADSWAKTFAALAGVPTFVFEAIKGRDWRGLKDPSDFVFLDPWDNITVVVGLEHLKDLFTREAVAAVYDRRRDATESALTERRYNQTVHVAWEGTFTDHGSLSHVNRELTRALSRQPKIEVTRVGDGHRAQAPTRTQVTVRHAWPPNWQRPKQGAWVLIQPWEFGSLPAEWVARVSEVDEVWAPSEYVRRVYVDSGVAPAKVKVVPNGIDPARFHPGIAPVELPTKKSFKFLFVGGMIGRKGPDVLLEAYRQTFTAADDVCLVIKDIPGIYDGMKFEPQDGPEILYFKEDWPAEKLAGLYAACDCLVLPYRGEGFCLPVLEAMACGLSVIVTAGGATDDFATDEFAYRISATRQRIGYAAGPFKLARPGWWLEPSLDELKERMRWVAEHRDEARAKGRAASEHVRSEWTWERAAAVAAERLQELARKPQRKKAVKIDLPACARLARPFPPAPANPRLTVCLIAKNEERFLAQCLRSVKDLAWQIVVVDTGSTDRTKGIAREFGAEVHDFKWCDDFSAARNAALEHARGDWVLMLDADEELTEEGRQVLRQEMLDKKVIAYRLPIVDVGKEDEGCSYVPRLFRNAPGLFYVGRIHEQVFSSIEVRRREWGMENRLSKATLRHHGYTTEIVRERGKLARNLRLLELAVEEMPDEPNLLMNYGMELVRAGQTEVGLTQYLAAFRILQSLPKDQVVPELRESLLTQLCTQLIGAKKFDEIVTLLDTPLAREHGGLPASLHFARGLALMELGRYREAVEDFRACLAKRDKPALTPINADIRKAGPHHCLAICLMNLRQHDAAGEAFQQALAADPQSRRVRLDFAVFLAERGLPVEALGQLHAIVTGDANDLMAWQLGGQLALSRAEFAEFARDWTGEAIKFFPRDAVVLAQRIEAQLMSGGELPAVPAEIEAVASREFVQWYRRALTQNAVATVEAVNGRLDELARVLPGAGRILQTALTEAQALPAESR